MMDKNARGYVQDSFHSLQEAKNCLEHALQTVEKSDNRERNRTISTSCGTCITKM